MENTIVQGEASAPEQPDSLSDPQPEKVTESAAEKRRNRASLPEKERAKLDKEEARQIVDRYFVNGIFTFPTTKVKVPVRDVPEAAFQQFFLDTPPIPPPLPPHKTMKNRRGKDILSPDYDNENYLRAVEVYEIHNRVARQHKIGEMIRYIYDKGTIIDVPPEWVEKHLDQLEPGADPSDKELKYEFLREQARSNAESKALLISICGRDPLEAPDADEDEDDVESEGV